MDYWNPRFALTAAVFAPFVARYLVAWTVAIRVYPRALGWFGSNVEPRRRISDYPKPNDPVVAMVVALAAAAAAWFVASILEPFLLRLDAPSWIWFGCLLATGIPSLVYAYRRIHADDVLTLRLLSERLAAQSASAPASPSP